MFKLLFRLFMLSLFLSGWGVAALSLHVVRTPDKIALIPKDHLGIADTYVDARHWTLNDFSAHPTLLKRVVEADHAPLFNYLINPRFGDAPHQFSAMLHDAAPQRNVEPNVAKLKAMLPINVTDQGISVPVVF